MTNYDSLIKILIGKNVMWRLKGGVENGKGFDTHANVLERVFLFAGCIRIARELRALLTVSISPLDSADDSLLVASVDVRKIPKPTLEASC